MMPFAPPAIDCQVMFASSSRFGPRPCVRGRPNQPQPNACGTYHVGFTPNVA